MPKAQILIVEDDAIVAKDIQNRLMALGYSADILVAYGEEAIKKVEEHKPDLVLMDIVLKGEMDGVEAAEIIRSRFSTPVIFLTAYAEEKRFDRAKLTLPYGYLLKPFRDRDLKITIAMALHASKLDAERRQAELALQESENKYRSLVESIDDYVYMVDRNCTYMLANSKYLSRIDLTLNRCIGRSCDELFPENVSEYFKEKIHEVFETGKSMTYEHNSERDGGYFLRTLSPVQDSNGKTSAVTVISKDITGRKHTERALKKSELDYRNLVETTADWVWSCDREGRQTFANTAVKEMLGYDAHEVLGVAGDSLMHPEDAKRVRMWFKKSVKEKKGWKNSILRWKHKDGNVRFLESTAKPVLDAEGNLVGFIGIDRDITDRKKSVEELKNSREQLQQLSSRLIQAQEEERRRISLELHDEMGQSLTAVEISLSEIEEDLYPALDSKNKDKFEEIHSIISKASEQISEMSLGLRPSMLDDLGLVPTLRWHFNTVAKRRGITIDFKSTTGDERLDSDIETVIYRIAQESLNNIIKHAAAKNVIVRLELSKGLIVFDIEDDGRGFDPDASVMNVEDGIAGFNIDSIGIVGMKERVSIVKGDLLIKSIKGHGTQIHVEIPQHIEYG